MGNTWRRFAAAYRMELRLLCFHWSYPLLHIGWAALLLYNFRTQDLGSAEAALKGLLGAMTLGLVSLVALFTGASAAARGQRTRFAALEDSFPTGLEVPFGRWLAVQTALMGAVLAPLGYAWFKLGPAESWLAGAPWFLGACLLTFAFTSAGAWWLVDRLGMRRWVYPLAAAGWLSFLIGFDVLRGRDVRFPALGILDFMRTAPSLYREAWGDLLEGRLGFSFNLFYVGLTGLLLALVAWRHLRRRSGGRPITAAVAMAMALAVAAAGARGYVGQYAEWQGLMAADTAANSLPGDPRGKVAEAVEAYEIEADLTAMHFTATMTVVNRTPYALPTIDLTLHQQFRITDMNLPYERQGNYLTIKQPLPVGGRAQVTVSYEGPLTVINKRWDGTPQVVFFTRDDGVRLSENAGWYPLPGHQHLLPDLGDLNPVPAAFRLTVTAPDGWTVASNLPATGEGRFAAQKATWASLVGSPRLAAVTEDGITLVSARQDIAVLRPYLSDYRQALNHLQKYFPQVHASGVTILAVDQDDGFPGGTPPADDQLVAMLERKTLTLIRRYPTNEYYILAQPLVWDLWTLSGGDPNTSYLQEIGWFLWSQYRTENRPKGGPVEHALTEVQASQGDAGVARVLEWVRRHPEAMDRTNPAQLAAQLKEAAIGAP